MLARIALLQFVRAVDPTGDPNSIEITEANLNTQNGQKYTVQQRLDIYNLARRVVLNALLETFGAASERVRKCLFVDAAISWTNNSTYSVALLPSGYITVPNRDSSLRYGSTPIRIIDDAVKVVTGAYPEYKQDANTLFAVQTATSFIHYANPSGTSLIPTGTYTITYVGITDHSISDIIQTSTKEETFLEHHIPLVIDVAVRIATGMSIPQALQYTVNILKAEVPQ